MSEKRGWGKTVLGWFIVQDGETARPDADALISKYASEPAPDPHPVDFKGPLPPVTGDSIDFAPVFDAAGVNSEEHDRVCKAQQLLRSLPAETPAPAKKQIVEASLKAFGVPTDRIIEASVEEIQALEGFILSGQQATQKTLTDCDQRIANLEADIAQVKQLKQQSATEQETRVRLANAEKLVSVHHCHPPYLQIA